MVKNPKKYTTGTRTDFYNLQSSKTVSPAITWSRAHVPRVVWVFCCVVVLRYEGVPILQLVMHAVNFSVFTSPPCASLSLHALSNEGDPQLLATSRLPCSFEQRRPHLEGHSVHSRQHRSRQSQVCLSRFWCTMVYSWGPHFSTAWTTFLYGMDLPKMLMDINSWCLQRLRNLYCNDWTSLCKWATHYQDGLLSHM